MDLNPQGKPGIYHYFFINFLFPKFVTFSLIKKGKHPAKHPKSVESSESSDSEEDQSDKDRTPSRKSGKSILVQNWLNIGFEIFFYF